MVDDSPNHSVLFHLTQLLDQHLLGDRRDRSFQIGKAQHLAAEQMEQNNELPPAFESLERALNTVGRRGRRVFLMLTSL